MVHKTKSLESRPVIADKDTAAIGREEFGRRIIECENLMYNVSRSMLHSDADCRDAIQEAVLAAWLGLGGLRDPRYFKTWLVRILINQCNAQLRKKRFAPGEIPPTASTEPDGDALAVRRAVESLPRKLQPVVALYYYGDFSTEEIARALGIARGTVKSRLAKARNDLRKVLD